MTTKRPWTEHVTWDKCPCGCDLYQLGNQRFGVFSEADARLLAAAPALYEALHNSLIIIMAQYEAGLKADAPDELMRHLVSSISDTTTALRAANPDAFESAEGEGE